MTYQGAMEEVDALSAALINTYGIKHGDRIAISMRNYPGESACP